MSRDADDHLEKRPGAQRDRFPRRNMTDLGPVAHGVAAGPTVDVEHDAVEALVPTGANLDQRAVDVRLSTFASDP